VFNDILSKRRSAFDELAKIMRSNFWITIARLSSTGCT
jgi:hypothetical protein